MPSRTTVYALSTYAASNWMLIPVVVPMKLRMSRRLELLKLNLERRAIRRVEDGDALRPRLLPEAFDRGPRARLLDAVADDALELGRAGGGEAIRAVHLDGLLVLDQRPVELIFLLEIARAEDVIARGVLHRPLELDLVFGVVRARLERLLEVLHRRIPIAGARRFAPFPEGPPRGTPRHEHGHDEQRDQPSSHELGSILQLSAFSSQFQLDS